jgi:hypothetical protein
MSLIRTATVELTVIPAIAYKQKLKAGGASVRIMRMDTGAFASAKLDKRTGEPNLFGKVDTGLFPVEAFEEAIELTCGMPYGQRENIKLSSPAGERIKKSAEPAAEEVASRQSMVDSDEYKAIVSRFTDQNGKMNYALMNKDFLQFANKSKVVAEMAGKGSKAEDIVLFVVANRAAHIAGKRDNLDADGTKALIETLDEIDPRSAFKELKLHIKRILKRK